MSTRKKAKPRMVPSAMASTVLAGIPPKTGPEEPASVEVAAAEAVVGVAVVFVEVAVAVEDAELDDTSTAFELPSIAVAFTQLFSLPSKTHRTSSLLPPVITTRPFGSCATA
jgi:hypothetical protein